MLVQPALYLYPFQQLPGLVKRPNTTKAMSRSLTGLIPNLIVPLTAFVWEINTSFK